MPRWMYGNQSNHQGPRPLSLERNDMKPSNLTATRNFADNAWIQEYSHTEPLLQRLAGYALALLIGVGMAALLVAWWSS